MSLSISARLATFLSGCAALVCEILWVRRLGDTFGHGAAAVAVVLATFFLGMGIGARVVGARADRSRDPARLYAALEIVLAVWALGFLSIVQILERLYFGSAAAAWPWGLQVLAKALGAVLVLIVPCVAMGGSVPVLVRGVVAKRGGFGVTVAWIYGLNTIGAACGALLAVFFALPEFGMRGALALAAALNVASAAVIWRHRLPARSTAARSTAAGGAPERDAAATDAPGIGASAAPAAAPQVAPLLAAALVAGFVAVGLEVAWTRALAARTSSTVFNFGVLLAAFLLALGIGSVGVACWERRRRVTRTLCGVSLCVAAVAAVASLPILRWFAGGPGVPVGGSLGAVQLRDGLRAIAVMLVPCLGFGATLPALARLMHREAARAGRDLGRVYLWNTVGSVAAAPLVAFWLLPAFGLTAAIGALAALAAVAGLALIQADRQRGVGVLRVSPVALALALTVLAALVSLPVDVRDWASAPGDRLLAYREGVVASVAVVETEAGDRVLKVNNDYRLGSGSGRFPQERQGLVPLLLHRGAERVAMLGLGTGSSAGAVAAFGVATLDVVEIVPEVVELLPFFAELNGDLAARARADASVRILATDARHFVRSTEHRYDVVIGDLFVPWRSGEGAMYTLEHFQAVRARLAPGGLFCQWLPLYQMGPAELRSIVATFTRAFPHASAWWLYFNVRTPTLGLVGGGEPLRLDGARLPQRFAGLHDGAAALLERNGLRHVGHLAACWVADRERLVAFGAGAPIDRRERPRLEFVSPRQQVRSRDARAAPTLAAALQLADEPGTPPWVAGWPPEVAERARRFRAAALEALHARVARAYRDDLDTAAERLARALESTPEWNWIAYDVEQTIRAALDRGRLASARRGAVALATASPELAHVGHYYAAVVALREGDRSSAERALRDALRQQPGHGPSERLLEQITERNRRR